MAFKNLLSLYFLGVLCIPCAYANYSSEMQIEEELYQNSPAKANWCHRGWSFENQNQSTKITIDDTVHTFAHMFFELQNAYALGKKLEFFEISSNIGKLGYPQTNYIILYNTLVESFNSDKSTEEAFENVKSKTKKEIESHEKFSKDVTLPLNDPDLYHDLKIYLYGFMADSLIAEAKKQLPIKLDNKNKDVVKEKKADSLTDLADKLQKTNSEEEKKELEAILLERIFNVKEISPLGMLLKEKGQALPQNIIACAKEKLKLLIPEEKESFWLRTFLFPEYSALTEFDQIINNRLEVLIPSMCVANLRVLLKKNIRLSESVGKAADDRLEVLIPSMCLANLKALLKDSGSLSERVRKAAEARKNELEK